MKQTYLHIGYPKTATTWFVDFYYPLVRNADVVYSSSIHYDFSEENSYCEIKDIPSASEKEKLVIVANKLAGLVDFVWNHGKYQTFFLEHLHRLHPDAHVIMFIRNQIDFCASAYSSYITHGGTYTFRKLFSDGRLAEGKMFGFEFLNYSDVISRYQEKFGKEKVHVFLYEDFNKDRQKFISEFNQKFGFEVSVDSIDFSLHNQKLRKGLAGLLRFANKMNRKGVQPKSSFMHLPWLFSWMTKNKLIEMNKGRFWGKHLNRDIVLGEDFKAFIREYYKKTNRELIEKHGFSKIEKYGYPL